VQGNKNLNKNGFYKKIQKDKQKIKYYKSIKIILIKKK